MIGGSGERKTLRMVAQYADEANLTCLAHEIPRKLDVLAEHCDRLGRDRSEIKVTKLVMIVIGRTHDDAVAAADLFAAKHNGSPAATQMRAARLTLGDPEEIGAALRDLMDLGIDGVTVNLAANAHDPEMVALAGETASAALG